MKSIAKALLEEIAKSAGTEIGTRAGKEIGKRVARQLRPVRAATPAREAKAKGGDQ